MTVARRLLTAGSGGSIIAPGLPAMWTRQGAVLSPSVAWEDTAIQELCILRDDETWKGWAKGGWETSAVGYYTSTDGESWTKYASNPVIGGGASGVAGEISQPEVVKVGATFWMFYNLDGDSPGNNAYVATSTDGIAWTVQGEYLTSGTITQWGNRGVLVKDGTWHQLIEGREGSDEWKIWYATSSNGTTWSFGNSGNPLTTLQVAASGMYGGPFLLPTRYGGLWQLYYHACPAAGLTPTNVYHSTSSDFVTWSTPELTLERAGSGDEADQIADPNLHLYNGTWYLWYDAVVNATETGVIKLATAPAT